MSTSASVPAASSRPRPAAGNAFSLARVMAIMLKEFVQMRRDRLTFAMIVGIPILQLALFGYAINTDPKALPTVVVGEAPSPFTRSLLAALQNTGYFKIVDQFAGEAQADRALQRGDAQFAIIIPPDFSRRLERGERPVLLVAADATDPAATGNALAALEH